MYKSLAIFLLLSVCACSSKKRNEEDNGAIEQKEQVTSEEKTSEEVNTTQNTVEIPGFKISIKFNRKARMKLKEINEKYVVTAYFSGTPIVENEVNQLQTEGIPLVEKSFVLDQEQEISFSNIKIPITKMNQIKDGSITVLVNVYSARETLPHNILDAEVLQGNLSEIKNKTHKVKVGLL